MLSRLSKPQTDDGFSNGDGTDFLFREVLMAGKYISRGFKEGKLQEVLFNNG
jgi:hypothetical protein